jgi:hypothetical protein
LGHGQARSSMRFPDFHRKIRRSEGREKARDFLGGRAFGAQIKQAWQLAGVSAKPPNLALIFRSSDLPVKKSRAAQLGLLTAR